MNDLPRRIRSAWHRLNPEPDRGWSPWYTWRAELNGLEKMLDCGASESALIRFVFRHEEGALTWDKSGARAATGNGEVIGFGKRPADALMAAAENALGAAIGQPSAAAKSPKGNHDDSRPTDSAAFRSGPDAPGRAPLRPSGAGRRHG